MVRDRAARCELTLSRNFPSWIPKSWPDASLGVIHRLSAPEPTCWSSVSCSSLRPGLVEDAALNANLRRSTTYSPNRDSGSPSRSRLISRNHRRLWCCPQQARRLGSLRPGHSRERGVIPEQSADSLSPAPTTTAPCRRRMPRCRSSTSACCWKTVAPSRPPRTSMFRRSGRSVRPVRILLQNSQPVVTTQKGPAVSRRAFSSDPEIRSSQIRTRA